MSFLSRILCVSRTLRWTLAVATLGLTGLFAGAAGAANGVWIESESASISPATPPVAINDYGHAAQLSGGKWLVYQIDAGNVDKQVTGPVTLTYSFTAPAAGQYDLWNRIGFEHVRSPFDWRIDGGAWTTVGQDASTVDVTDFGNWAPVGWLDMGKQQLAAGKHTLDIRISKSKDAKGATAGFIYTSDALYLTTDPFYPNGKVNPLDPGSLSADDRAAAAKVFDVPAPAGTAQTSVPLAGLWQAAAYDELKVQDRTGPIKSVPDASQLNWIAVPVPSSTAATGVNMNYVHRYFLRTRVNVPAALAGRGLFLHFPNINVLGTVFVNGQQVGFDNTPLTVFDCDITRAIRPGQVNEIWVGIKDAFYALASVTEGTHPDYTPYDFWHYNTTLQLDFPVLAWYQNGLLETPSLVVAGKAYTSDVFALPSVKNKSLGLWITVHNPTTSAMTVTVDNAVVPLAGGPAEKTFASKELQVPAGQDAELRVSEPWANPKLWWPDDPQQYHVITKLSVGGQPIDERTTKFGFREWDWHGPTFTLNGVPWHGRADTDQFGIATAESMALRKKRGQTMDRYWGALGQSGMELQQTLDFYDSHGMPIRHTGIFDGEGAGGFYGLVTSVNGQNVPNPALWANWERQAVAWIKSERNHPSIFLWSMENEISFINSHVMGLDPLVDVEEKKASDLYFTVDPTRPQMTDGGNAGLQEELPVYGGHYLEAPTEQLPGMAYDFGFFAHAQSWPITHVKPILIGESWFTNGNPPAYYSMLGGDAAFVGKAEAEPAIELGGKMLSEGYRWNNISFQLWMSAAAGLLYNSWQPVAVLCRQWDWTFSSGQAVDRTLKIFNDEHNDEPITLKWVLTLGGRQVATASSVHHVAAGMDAVVPVTLHMPSVSTRQNGTWVLTLYKRGKQVFRDTKPVSVLPVSAAHRTARALPQVAARCLPGGIFHGLAMAPGNFSRSSLAVYDPHGKVAQFLSAQNMPFTRITSLANAPASAKVLVVGNDALTPAQSTASTLAAYAASGRTVIVLEQTNVLRYQALPAQMTPDTTSGRIAFIEDVDSPVMRGLEQQDFFTWNADEQVYRNAYQKPAIGGKSLVQCGDQLHDTALAQLQAGKGLMLVSQLLIGQKIATNAVAQQLLLNMIDYGEKYKLVYHAVTVAANDNPQLMKALDATGLQYSKATDPLEAVSKPGTVAIVNATPANLHKLAANKAKVNAFTQGGGWIIFNNLSPDGLADYDQLVGVPHMIRSYGQEKVTWPAQRNPLTAGLPTSAIVMGSGQQMAWFNAGQWPDSNEFSYIVDYDDPAPFGKSPFFAFDKITNGFTQQDGYWQFIINFPAPADGSPFQVPITLPKPQTITQWTWVSDLNYQGTKKVSLIFNGSDKLSFNTVPNGNPQTFPINPPRTAQNIILEIDDWQHDPAKQAIAGGKDLIGIDNIYFKATRPANFWQRVKPMLNIGGMVEYPRGQGGLILCNLKYLDTEQNAENVGKKQAVIAGLLRNLSAPFAGGKTIIAGANNLTYTPIDISKKANQYRTEQGWFGDKSFTFTDIPTGPHTFAGVTYSVYNFLTSQVPTLIMLGGTGIPGSLPDQVTGIPVGRKADALFFLQAARLDQRRSPDEVKNGKQYEMADYVVNYADGTTVKVPVYAEINVDDYKQKGTPAALPGAQIAWTKPYGTTGQTAVAYSQQWNNPHPDKVIKSIDFVYGPDRRGVPALLALTAASAQ